ncbi:MAG: NAD(P)-dependent alcohol dehydrogenase [Planctomycetota bacterium]
MKAAVLTAPRTIEIQERPVPEPGPGEARIRIAAVGVCGSDVHYYEEGRIGRQIVQYPTLLGHEAAGVVDAVGPGVDLEPGTRVAIEPAASCGRCECCQAGQYHICPHVKFLGTPPIDGIFEQYHLMPAHCCIPIPDTLSLVEAALTEPLGVGLHAVALARPALGETAAVFGSGPIGLCTLLALRLTGVKRVFATDLVPDRLSLAETLGADAVLNAGQGDVVEWIREETGGRGVDVTFEAAGEQETVTHACRAAAVGGRALLIGIPSEDERWVPMHECRRKELLMRHVRRSNGEAARCLPLVTSGRLDLKPLATHFFPLEKVTEAFDLVHRYADGVIRAIIQPNDELAES